MIECRHGLSEDCPACMQATIDVLVKALQSLVDNVNDYERVNNLSPSPGRTECWDTVAMAKQVLALVGKNAHD